MCGGVTDFVRSSVAHHMNWFNYNINVASFFPFNQGISEIDEKLMQKVQNSNTSCVTIEI